MKHLQNVVFFILILNASISCSKQPDVRSVKSPDGRIALSFKLINKEIYYSVVRDDVPVLNDSKLGFQFANMSSLDKDFRIVEALETSFSETWEQSWGEKRFIDNKYNQLQVKLEENSGQKRKMEVFFRVFNDGIGFRYLIPEQENIDSIKISKEETEFNLPRITNAWWIPAAYKENSYYESLYRHTPVNKMDTIHTPVTIEAADGSYLAIHEANLTNYAAMTLYCADSSRLCCDLVPWSDGIKVYSKTPMYTPWRSVRIAESAGALITNYLELNLNEPLKIEDVSWIKPAKYIGIWWGMHMGIYTWPMGPKHGASTQNVLRYIDFAAENGFDGVLVEGWNQGWEYDWANHGEKFSFTKAYSDFDLVKICKYASEKNVELIGHHETGGSTKNYENQMEAAFALCRENGINNVKTGYVGQLLDGKEWHDGQYGVNHYRKVIETAARYQINIDNHEPVKPTGLQRTYPNIMSHEGARGQEYNAWSTDGGNPPEHTTILPFTRILAGPLDYTPGVFNFENLANPATKVQSTLANQLALYIVIYSPLQMACDLPENYTLKQPFQFIKDVAVDWQVTKVINAEIGDYVTIVRKDRNSDDWFLGSITDENARSLTIDLSFLDAGVEYKAEIYADGKNADWKTNPLDFEYTESIVRSSDHLLVKLAPGGGQAIRFTQKK